MTVKNERIASLIQRNISDIIQFSVKNKNIGFVTVTDVKVTKDLSFAKVFVTFLSQPQNVDEKMDELNKTKGFIRTELSKKMSTYKVPELIFTYDDSLDKGNRITDILNKVNNQ